jgi:hypothetical protein
MLFELPHLEMVGWGGIYRPQHKTSRWRKVVALCSTPGSTVGSPDSPVHLSGVPSHWIWHCRWSLAVQAFTPDSSDVIPNSPVASLHQCHLELSIGLLFPGAPDSPPVATLVFVSWTLLDTCWSSCDLRNVFFWGVAFLNALVQVTLAPCELQT